MGVVLPRPLRLCACACSYAELYTTIILPISPPFEHCVLREIMRSKFLLRYFFARVEVRTTICKKMHRLLLRNHSCIANQSAHSIVQHTMFKRKRNWQYYNVYPRKNCSELIKLLFCFVVLFCFVFQWHSKLHQCYDNCSLFALIALNRISNRSATTLAVSRYIILKGARD